MFVSLSLSDSLICLTCPEKPPVWRDISVAQLRVYWCHFLYRDGWDRVPLLAPFSQHPPPQKIFGLDNQCHSCLPLITIHVYIFRPCGLMRGKPGKSCVLTAVQEQLGEFRAWCILSLGASLRGADLDGANRRCPRCCHHCSVFSWSSLNSG